MTTSPRRALHPQDDRSGLAGQGFLPWPAWPPREGSLADLVPSAFYALGRPTAGRYLLSQAATGSGVIIVWLVDGLGYDQLQRARQDGLMPGLDQLFQTGRTWLRSLWSVYPSVTPIALSSLLTGSYPSEHGLIGRVLNMGAEFPTFDSLAKTRKPAGAFDLARPTLDRQASDVGLDYLAVLEHRLLSGTLTQIIHPNADKLVTHVSPMGWLPTLVDSIPTDHRGLVYTYWSYLDALNHLRGPYSPEWIYEMRALDRRLHALANVQWPQPGPVWLWVVSDHGHIAVAGSLSYPTLRKELPWLQAVPYGSDRLLTLAVPDERIDDVITMCAQLFGDRVAVWRTHDLWRAHVFGPPVNPQFQSRAGNVVLEPTGGWFWVLDDDKVMAAGHGGRSPEEMVIPWLEILLS